MSSSSPLEITIKSLKKCDFIFQTEFSPYFCMTKPKNKSDEKKTKSSAKEKSDRVPKSKEEQSNVASKSRKSDREKKGAPAIAAKSHMLASSELADAKAQNPLILRFHRLVDAFSKADDERDFYLDRYEGFIIYANLDKGATEIESLEQALRSSPNRYCSIPKMSFYEQKKLMEGFANEKVYDIDTKEKLGDLVSSKNPRENFLEYLLDLHMESEKWQLYFLERFRIKIIEWLRREGFSFVFEEDLEIPKELVEKIKRNLFILKAPKEVLQARKTLESRAQIYYQSEALNPRPKRGRPPKQIVKVEIEPQISPDVFTTVPQGLYPFLFVPELHSPAELTFSSRFGTHDELARQFRALPNSVGLAKLEALSQKLTARGELLQQKKAPGTLRVLEESPAIPQPVPGGAFDGNGEFSNS